jgi:hypothetical protein
VAPVAATNEFSNTLAAASRDKGSIGDGDNGGAKERALEGT